MHNVMDVGCPLGPIRPGVRVDYPEPLLRVGNAAGETHPLVGEGIGMALQSAALLASSSWGARPRSHTSGSILTGRGERTRQNGDGSSHPACELHVSTRT